MLYFIHGTDRGKIKAKQHEVLAALRIKRPNSNFVILDVENFSEAGLDELIQGGGLFDEKHIVALNDLFGDKQWGGAAAERIEGMAKSPSAFVCIDEKVEAKVLKEIGKYAYKTLHFEKREAEQDERGAVFAIADAVGEKNSTKAWALYQKLLRRGISPEEIHGAIFWQVKSIALAHKTSTANEAGMKEFPYGKAKRFARNFSEEEIRERLSSLVFLYHDSRAEDSSSLETALEKFLLEK